MDAAELDAEIAAGVAFWGYEADGELLGVMGIQAVGDVDLIRHAYVTPGRQRAGIGGALLRHLCAAAGRPMLVGTWAAADWAIRFYERHGFELVSPERKTELLRTYWSIPERQIETSVVLAGPPLGAPLTPLTRAGTIMPGRMDASAAIEVEGLTKRYGSHVAVDGVSLTVERGEVFGILGPNGAGKTTTLEMIEGLRKPDAGDITVLGRAVWPDPRSIQARIGVQLQTTSLFDMLTAQRAARALRPLLPALRRRRAGGELARAGRARVEGGRLRQEPLRRTAAAARDRARARPRSRGRVPGRADDRPRPAGPAQPLGRDPLDQPGAREDGGPHHALPRGGRGALRPRRHHGRGADRRPRHARPA